MRLRPAATTSLSLPRLRCRCVCVRRPVCQSPPLSLVSVSVSYLLFCLFSIAGPRKIARFHRWDHARLIIRSLSEHHRPSISHYRCLPVSVCPSVRPSGGACPSVSHTSLTIPHTLPRLLSPLYPPASSPCACEPTTTRCKPTTSLSLPVPACLCLSLPACLFVCVSLSLSIEMFIGLCLCNSLPASVFLFLCLLSICLYICLSFCQSVCRSLPLPPSHRIALTPSRSSNLLGPPARLSLSICVRPSVCLPASVYLSLPHTPPPPCPIRPPLANFHPHPHPRSLPAPSLAPEAGGDVVRALEDDVLRARDDDAHRLSRTPRRACPECASRMTRSTPPRHMPPSYMSTHDALASLTHASPPQPPRTWRHTSHTRATSPP